MASRQHNDDDRTYSKWESRCPICKSLHGVREPSRRCIEVHCPVSCGDYLLDHNLDQELREIERHSPDDRLVEYLSFYTRRRFDRGGRAYLRATTWRVQADRVRRVSPRTKALAFLRQVAKAAGNYMLFVEYDSLTAGITIGEPSSVRLASLTGWLRKERFIEFEEGAFPTKVALTAKGWQRYLDEARDKGAASDGNQVNSQIASVGSADNIDLTESAAVNAVHSNDKVNRAIAEKYLGLTTRQIRNLISSKKLETVGEGQYKRITTASLRRYKGDL